MYDIEHGVKVPGEGRSKYPWEQMDIGDSFFVPEPDAGAVRSAASAARKRLSTRYKCSKRVEDGVAGIRVWRIEDDE